MEEEIASVLFGRFLVSRDHAFYDPWSTGKRTMISKIQASTDKNGVCRMAVLNGCLEIDVRVISDGIHLKLANVYRAFHKSSPPFYSILSTGGNVWMLIPFYWIGKGFIQHNFYKNLISYIKKAFRETECFL